MLAQGYSRIISAAQYTVSGAYKILIKAWRYRHGRHMIIKLVLNRIWAMAWIQVAEDMALMRPVLDTAVFTLH